jgi:hypothetical protein
MSTQVCPNKRSTPCKTMVQFACQNIQQRPGMQIIIELSTGYANTPHLTHNKVSPEKPGL